MMVRLKGPAVSAEASGSLAKALTFATNNKRRSMRAHAKPKDTKSPTQLAVRAMMKFLSTNWKALSTADQATWAQLARANQYAPYHAFIKYNMQRWRTFRPPAKVHPPAETPPAPTPAGLTAFGGFHFITFRLWLPPAPAPWAWTLHVLPGGPTATIFETTRHVLLKTGAGDVYYTMRDLQPGVYKVRARAFSNDGLWGIPSSERSCTVT